MNSRWCLLLLVVQNTSKTLLMRSVVHGERRFLYSSMVVSVEALKAVASGAWLVGCAGYSPRHVVHFLRLEWRVFVRLLVPAVVYNAQQILEMVALSRLEAPTFSVVVQSKILVTALFSKWLLGAQLSQNQFVALVMLTVSVVLAQRRSECASSTTGGSDVVGIFATLSIAVLSGFAAVYTERVLKRTPYACHVDLDAGARRLGHMQLQMACACLCTSGSFAVLSDGRTIVLQGFWHGFDAGACAMVVSSAMGGLLVAATLHYATSILKGYATSVSVLLTGLLSHVLFRTEVGLNFLLATTTIACSIFLYSRPYDV